MSDDDSFVSACSSLGSFSCFNDSLTINRFLNGECQHFHNCLNVCHVNAQSVPQHHSELLDMFSDTLIHAILISETWLKPELLSTSYSLPGFILIRNDRTGRRAGGVAIYLRSDIPFKILYSSPSFYSGSLEGLMLEVDVRGVKAILGVVYCPPAINYFSHLEILFETFSTEYKHHIIMGDFNTDLIKSSLRSRGLRSILESSNLSLLPLNPTHCNVGSDDSWLDLMLVSSLELVVNHGQVAAPGLSRHDLIYLSYKIRPPRRRPALVYLRNFARMDKIKLNSEAQSIDWTNVYQSTSIDEKVNYLNESVLKLLDAHAPLKAVRVRRPPAPWITPGIKMAMRRRNRAFCRYKRDRSDENWGLYRLARNRCNQMVRAAKRRYIFDNVQNSSQADVWKFLKTLGVCGTSSSVLPTNISLNTLNLHFASSSGLADAIKVSTIADITSKPISLPDTFTFSPVTENEIQRIFASIKSRAVGCDGVGRTMISLILEHFLPIFTHIINFSLFHGVFPTTWQKAHIIPLPKIPNPCRANDYRPISILPYQSKILEAVVHRQISSYILKHKLLSSFQSGFRPGHSTSTALLKVTEDVRCGMEDSRLTVLILIDFSNAFNAVDHDILLAILTQSGVSSSSREWFSAYLRGRQQSVRVGQELSDWGGLTAGVPQGGILSPLLFSLFINSITSLLTCSYHLYADDLQLYAQARIADMGSCIQQLNANLLIVEDWSKKYGVTVNVGKCQAIVLGSSYYLSCLNTVHLEPIIFDKVTIPLSPHVKDLGLYLDRGLSWNHHVTQVSKRVTTTLRSLYRFKNFLPPNTKALLVRSLVLPVIDYADVCYSDLSQDLLNKLDRMLNNCIRFIFGLRKYDHVSSFRAQLKWLPIRERRSLRSLCMLFSILNDPCAPEYLKSGFQILGSSHSRNLRSAESLLLEIPSHHTSFVSNSFRVSVIKLWNALPHSIKMAPNKMAFKRSVREAYLKALQR